MLDGAKSIYWRISTGNKYLSGKFWSSSLLQCYRYPVHFLEEGCWECYRVILIISTLLLCQVSVCSPDDLSVNDLRYSSRATKTFAEFTAGFNYWLHEYYVPNHQARSWGVTAGQQSSIWQKMGCKHNAIKYMHCKERSKKGWQTGHLCHTKMYFFFIFFIMWH